MSSVFVEKEILDLENRYWQAIRDKNLNEMVLLTDFPVLVTGASGASSIDQSTFARMMENGGFSLNAFKIENPQVRLLEDDVAAIAYKVHEELTVDGEKISLDAADSSVWVRRTGQWRCAVHTESLPGDPYGRDRKKTR